MEHGATHHEVKGSGRKIRRAQVGLTHGEVLRWNQANDLRIDVDGCDAACGPDHFAEPLCHAAVAATKLKTVPAFPQAQGGEMGLGVRIKNLRHQIEPLVLSS